MYMMMSAGGVLYVGVTTDLEGRVWEHKHGTYDGFTKKYSCHSLVWFEEFSDIRDAIARERQIKRWRREKKVWLLQEMNPSYQDLAASWFGAD